jgi:lipopolysaccharide export system protein LptA
LWCEGAVHVLQDPAKAEEKGTDVKGDTLRMTAGGDGNYFLVVTGDLAELQTDKIYIIGPEVNIDQTSNKAWVIGDGAMKMDSATNLQGEPLDKPVPLTVHWSKSMLFNGESAEFHGNIQAVQEKARMACQRLQVYFDRTVSLKQGNKTDEPAKVRNLVCDREVRVEESVYEGEKLVKYNRLEALAAQMMALDPEDGETVRRAATPPGGKPAGKTSAGNVVYASGPGNLRIWEPSTGEDLSISEPRPATGTPRNTSAKAAPAARPGSPAKPPEMKMTFVYFRKRMDANSKTSTAYFWENVRVLHMPCPRHDTPIDLDQILAHDLPENSLYIACDRLKVLDRPEDNRPNKQMESHGKVYVQGKEFYARADSLYYNQLKNQIILDSSESGHATLYKVTVQGEKPQEVVGKRIIYNRGTGKIDVSGATSIIGESVPRR